MRPRKIVQFAAMLGWFALPVAAENYVGQVQGISYAISENGLGVFQARETQWVVRCSVRSCVARSDSLFLVVDASGVSVDTDLTGNISVWQNRTSQPLPKGRPLALFERDTLLAAKSIVLTDPNAASIVEPFTLSVAGVGVVVAYMEMWLSREIIETPTRYLALAEGRNIADPSRLVPFTKPQIEFAIRSQVDPP